MYKYVIFNQHTQYVKNILGYFIKKSKLGCKVELFPYNNMFCDVIIQIHPNYDYTIIRNYIHAYRKQCKCSNKAKKYIGI